MTRTELIVRRQRLRKLTLSDAQIDVALYPKPSLEDLAEEIREELSAVPAVAALAVQSRALCARDVTLTPEEARRRVLMSWRR